MRLLSRYRFALLCAATLAVSAVPADAALMTSSIEPSGSWIRADQPDNGIAIQGGDDGPGIGSDIFFLGSVNGTDNFRALMSLDLSSLPTGAQITDVSFTILTQRDILSDVSANNFDATMILQLLDVTPDYTGTAPTWNNYTDALAWTTPGGDFAPSILAQSDQDINLTTVAVNDVFTFSSTASLVSAAQAAFDANESFDVILRAPDLENVSGRSLARFNGPGRGSSGSPPIFAITYTVIPEPASVSTFAVLLFGGLLARRRTV